MTKTRRRSAVRRTSIPRVSRGYSGLLAKLNAASSKLSKARGR
jgi:hypothetical protein